MKLQTVKLARDDVRYEYINTYEPLGWQIEPWRDKSPIMLLSGSAGGGKSKLAAEKLHGYCLRYPGSTALMLRKIRASMSNSTLLFVQRHVIGRDPRVQHKQKDFRFEYHNGSILAYGGMKDEDQREYIRSIGQSGGVDIAWMEEATQFAEEDFNELLARMRGNATTWRQVILSTNPDAPLHWIRRRFILGGEASVYYSSALDNPYLPEDYAESLSKMSGVEYRRLVLGEWCEGAGRVFDTFKDEFNPMTGADHGGNVTLSAEYIPGAGPIVWAIDDGYAGKMDKKTRIFTSGSHPRAILLCQLRSNGQVAVFYESYAVEVLSPDHIEQMLGVCTVRGWPRPNYIVRDRAAASLEGALKQFHLRNYFNQHLVVEGIKEMRTWVGADGNGFRRVLVHPRCTYLRNEFMSYALDENGNVIKAHDHGLDALRYLIWHLAFSPSTTVDVALAADFLPGGIHSDTSLGSFGIDVAVPADFVGEYGHR